MVEENHIEEGLVRITVTAGERPTVQGSTTITTRSLPEIPSDPALHIATSARRLSGPLSQCKSIGRTAESKALREALAEGAFDGVLLNEKGRVVETTSRNLFAMVGKVLRTPSPREGALPGITRAAVFAIASSLKIQARETSLTVEAMRGAEEVFLTGSGVGILRVASIDGRRWPTPRATTEAIAQAYASVLDSESRW